MEEEKKHELIFPGPNPYGFSCYCKKCGKGFGMQRNAKKDTCDGRKKEIPKA